MDETDYTTKQHHIFTLVRHAKSAKLEGCDFLALFSVERIAEEYNGIGPAFLPDSIREKLTKHLKTFEAAALIHDMRFACSDGYRLGYNIANSEFRDNCLALADRKYYFWDPRRYCARHVAHILYRFVSGAAGWHAWREAAKKNQGN